VKAISRAFDRLYGVHEFLEDVRVVDVGRSSEDHRERDAPSVRNNVVALRARLSLIRRVRAGPLAPFWQPRSPSRRSVLSVHMVGFAQPIQEHPVQLAPHARLLPVAQAPPAGAPGTAAHLLGQHLALCVPQRSLEHYELRCSKSYENGATS
jgi:hypothetical protein